MTEARKTRRPPRLQQCIDLVVAANGSGIGRRAVAQAMGCADGTAGQYLWLAKRDGAIVASGVGCRTVWTATAAAIAAAPALRRVSSVFDLGAL